MRSNDSSDFQQKVLSELEQINQRLDRLENDVEKLDYKFDTYQKASDQVFRLTTTIVVAAASVVVLTPVTQAFAPIINAIVSGANN